MKSKKKIINIILVTLSIMLFIGIVGIYIIGEKKFNQKQNNLTGAQEVYSANSNNLSKEEELKQQALKEEALKQEKVNQEKEAELLKIKDPFAGMTLRNNEKGIPILMYHSIDIDPEGPNELRIPKEDFREQMKFLKEEGYTTLTMTQVYELLENNKPVPEKSVVITFDDGYIDNYTNAFPVLKEFGFKATIFMISNLVDTDPAYLTSEQLRTLEANGIEIQNHTSSHPQLNTLSYENQLKEIKNANEVLEKILNKKIEFIAYPYGEYDENTLKVVKELGFKAAFTADSPWAYNKDTKYLYRRVYISAFKDLESFKDRVTNPNYTK